MMSTEPLKPCPWCARVDVTCVEASLPEWANASCANCHAFGPDIRKEINEPRVDREARALAAWNKRRRKTDRKW